jgi:hypothetical protein
MNGQTQAAASDRGLPHIPYQQVPTDSAAGVPIVTFNQITLTSGQLMRLVAAVVTLIGGGAAGGWLFMPAKETDLKALNAVVETIKDESAQQREAIGRLVVAVERITDTVAELRDKPPAVVQVPAPTVRRAAPRPKPPLPAQ